LAQNEQDAAVPDAPPGWQTVPLDELRAVDFLSPLNGVEKADCHALQSAYMNAVHTAQAAGRQSEAHVLRLFEQLCGIHFKVNDRAGVFGPQATMSGRRTAIPDDFRGEQNRVLESIVVEITHPGLRARIADVVWTNDRKSVGSANAALEAYCETVEGLVRGVYKPQFDMNLLATFDEIDLIYRAVQISAQINKKGQIPDRVRDNVALLYDLAQRGVEPIPFERLGRICLHYRLADAKSVAADAEAMAVMAAALPKTYPIAIKKVWALAADAYAEAGDRDASRRCRLEDVEQTLAMQKQVGGAGAAAHWVRTAIHELRHINGTGERREELRAELRVLQERALDDFHPIGTPLDVGDIQADVAKEFESLTLSDALLKFAAFTGSRSTDELRKEAFNQIKASPLSSLFGTIHTDEEGKYVAESPSPTLTENEPDEEAVKRMIAQLQGFWRQYLVAGYIEPARNAIGSLHSTSERQFETMAAMSPFIPDSHAYIYALGFARFMQGDFVSAAHLLVPQFEHSIRYVLRSANKDSSKIMPDMLQEDRPLSALLDNFRPELEAIFTADVVNEIDLLFNYRPPALRHEFAHGKVGAGHCFHADVIYACWFIYRISCLPLFPYWSEHIAPSIEEGR